MPITISIPASGERFGPGFVTSFSSDFVGPVINPSWFLSLSTEEGVIGAYQSGFAVSSHSDPVTTDFMGDEAVGIMLPAYVSASTLFLRVELRSNFTTTVEYAERAVVPDFVTGAQHVLSRQIGSTVGDFTTSDRATLQASLEASQVSIPGIGGDLLIGLGQLLQGVPRNFTNRHGSVVIFGAGSFSRGTEPFRLDSLGIEWHWHTIPPEAGKLIGDPDTYTQRVVQWRVIDQDSAGQTFQSDTIDSSQEGVRHVWGVHVPITLEYYVSPGWEVELSFLVAAFG